jgi:hypothetical protein
MMKLSQNMIDALIYNAPGDMIAGGPTRAALIRRGLVTKLDGSQGRGGIMTPAGEHQRWILLIDAELEHA